jgi:hypothetical protein
MTRSKRENKVDGEENSCAAGRHDQRPHGRVVFARQRVSMPPAGHQKYNLRSFGGL